MKQYIFWLSLLTLLYIHDITQPENTPAMPSVSEVFQGRSLEDIAKEIEATEALMAELHEKGSPEEIAEFYKMIEQTMAQMTEKDWEDIMGITNAVTPLLAPEKTQLIPQENDIADNASLLKPETKIQSGSALEDFKNLIDSIIARIDAIFQKINSSKATSEHVSTQWTNNATFANLKRLIAHLRITRLAEKFIKDDAPADIKEMKTLLQELAKTFTFHDDTIKIEDSFGLSSDRAADKKNISMVNDFLDSCDQAIDNLMPKLEKFLEKFDPEALQLAKEAEQKAKKAVGEATLEAKRTPSPIARPTTQANTSSYNPTGSNYLSDGYYPNSYGTDYGNYGNYGFDQNNNTSPKSAFANTATSTPTTPSTAPKSKSEIDATTGSESKEKSSKTDTYTNIISDFAGHIDDYDTKHENEFINFLRKEVADNYPNYSFIIGQGKGEPRATNDNPPLNAAIQAGTSGSTMPTTEDAWIEGTAQFKSAKEGFKPYTITVLDQLKSKFSKEFDDAKSLLTTAKESLHKMTSEELTKLQSNNDLNKIEARFKKYKDTFEDTLSKINAKMHKNAPKSSAPEMQLPATEKIDMQSTDAINKYMNRHYEFVNKLKTDIGDEIESLLSQINSIKRHAKRNATNKKKLTT